MDFPVPSNEPARLAVLRSLKILDTLPDERFDRIVRIACEHYRMPVVRITFVDEDRVWFKARVGMKAQQAPRSISICAHTIMTDEVLVVPDLTADLRFAESPQVTGEPHFRFYAAAPISVKGGFRIGSVCLMDYIPHPDFFRDDAAFLQELAEIVVDELDLYERIMDNKSIIDSRARDLKDSEERFELAMRGANDGLWDWDLQTDTVYYSPRWCSMLGYDSEELAPTLVTWASLVEPEAKDRVLKLAQDCISGAVEAFDTEFKMRHKNGSWVSIWARAFLVKEEDQPVRFVGTHVDISLRKQLEEQIHQSQKMEAIGQLTGGVAHDFNNLLGVMLGNAEAVQILLGDGESNRKVRRHVDEVIKAIDRSASLTQRLLSFSRQQVLLPATTDVGDLVHGFEDMLRRTLGETIDLTVALGAQVWPATVDAHQFENALLNLAINARDAMPKGGALAIATGNVTLDDAYAEQYEDLSPGDYVKVTVSDTGTGIEAENLDKVIEPFYTTKEVGEGSGLGLSMVYGFAKQSKGHITIASEVGQGTTVELYLPRSNEAVEQDDAKDMAAEAFAQRSERILVVEDDENLREIPVSLFRDQGFEVAEAKDGAEALEHLRDGEAFDLLFTDVVLPGGMNGVEIAAEARRLQPDIEVLFTTGYAQSAIAENGVMGDAVHVISKPYRSKELLEKVGSLLDGDAD